jgi:hypothetical protein
MSYRTTMRTACAVSLSATTLALAAGNAVPVDANGDLMATNAVASAFDRSEIIPNFHVDAFLADDIAPLPDHPPIDQIPVLDMPNTDLWGNPDAAPGNPVFYDPQTGETIEVPFPEWANRGAGDAQGGGFVGADGVLGFEDMYGTRGFGSMSTIAESSLDDNPWRMNCKLVMEYTDSGNGSTIYRVCSGAMQDPEVVLTAGHCVYNRDNDSTGNDYGFATRIWVYPGWDGDGLALGDPGVIQTHGWAVSTGMVAWTGYTVDGDFDADIGLVRLGRAVGMLTGWFGWRSSDWDSCNTLDLTFSNASFPAESCGQPGLHNGRDMYYWFGDFDSCQAPNQLRINTTPGCFTALWGGQSGSNAYDIDGSSRYAHAVASNSNRTTIGQYCKLWTGARTYMNDTFKPDARGSSLDIQALKVRLEPATILAGEATTAATAQVPNPTNNDPASATYGFNMYLSTNNNISTGDTLLAARAYTFDYAAMQNVNLNTGNVTIPKNTPSGTYWVGIVLDDQDANYANNDSDLWDAQQITVNGIADIVANSCGAPSGTAYHGDTINVSYNVENEGGDPSNSVTLTFYASTNTDISSFDTELGSVNIGTFSGSQVKSGSVNLNIPSSLQGAYYIGYIASASDDYYVNQSNEAYDATTLNIEGRSDLFANYLTALDSQAAVGGSMDVRFNVQNTGTISSGTYTVDVYASTNTTISSFDTLLGSFNRPSLAVGGSSTIVNSVNIPLVLTPGDYYVGMVVGAGVNENNTADNMAYDANQVTFTDCPVDFNNNGVYDLADINAFVSAFLSQGPIADLDGNGIWDLTDIVAFVDAFTLGCP